jgi:hypothetical protein
MNGWPKKNLIDSSPRSSFEVIGRQLATISHEKWIAAAIVNIRCSQEQPLNPQEPIRTLLTL